MNLRSGRPGKLPAPVEGYQEQLDPAAQALVRQMLSCRVVGGPETVDKGIREFAERTGADELMVTGMIFDRQKRLRSYEIVSNSIA